MANFQDAFNYMLRHEDYNQSGVVTPEPGGGKARFGINSVANPHAVADGFYEMSRDAALMYAQDIYLKVYWNNHGFDTIQSQQVASKLFDTAVNMGTGGEIGVLQVTLEVPVTHKLDAPTMAGLQYLGPAFLQAFVANLKQHYQDIANSNPGKYAKYMPGWMARAGELPPPDRG